MGQKVNPIGFRLSVRRDWQSRWFSNKKEFGANLKEDHQIRTFLGEKFRYAAVPRIFIERAGNRVRIKVFTARPGIVIGRKGAELEKIKESLIGSETKLTHVLEEIVNTEDPLGVLRFQNEATEKLRAFTERIKQTLDELRGRIRDLQELDLMVRPSEEEQEIKTEEVLFLSVAEHVFAVPLNNVKGIFKIPGKKALELSQRKEIKIQADTVPLSSMWPKVQLRACTSIAKYAIFCIGRPPFGVLVLG